MTFLGFRKRATRENSNTDCANAVAIRRRQQLAKVITGIAFWDRLTGRRNQQMIENLGAVEGPGVEQRMQIVGSNSHYGLSGLNAELVDAITNFLR